MNLTNLPLIEVAKRYAALGLRVIPVDVKTKRAVVKWGDYVPTTFEEFERADGIAVACGAKSGNLEVIDFDYRACFFNDFCELCAKFGVGERLFDLVQEQTQNGGKHLIYRCEELVEGSQKLARRVVPGARIWSDEYEFEGKKLIRDKKTGCFIAVTIETRGEGGYFVCAPSPGYVFERGTSFESIPTLTKAERETLFEAARRLDEGILFEDFSKKAPQAAPPTIKTTAPIYEGESVADYLRSNGVVAQTLERNGWKRCGAKGNQEFWTRPGKKDGVSAILNVATQMFYCYSSNAYPVEQNKTYTPLQLVAAFDYDGDESAASKDWIIRIDEATAPVLPPDFKVEFNGAKKNDENAPEETPEPSPEPVEFPQELFECGGLIGAIADYTNATAFRPQPVLSFAGALALVSYAVGRKISADSGKTTPNLFLVGLCGAGGGKNAARATNSKILSQINGEQGVIEKFESVQSLQNAIVDRKKVFWQQDEFGQELKQFSARNGANKAGIVGAVLTLYTSASFVQYAPRVVASNFTKKQNYRTDVDFVDFPFLTLYATTTYTDFNNALTKDFLTNGFLARMTLFSGANYSPKKMISFDDRKTSAPPNVPEEVVQTVQSWFDFRDVKNNIDTPELFDVDYTRDAWATLQEYELELEAEQELMTADGREGLREFYGRGGEKMRKYALLFAASEYGPDEEKLIIDERAAKLAILLTKYDLEQFRQFVGEEFANTESQRAIVEAKKWVASVSDGVFTKSEWTKRFWRLDKRDRETTLETLIDLGLVESFKAEASGKGRPKIYYKINR